MEGPHLHGEREASREERESKEVRMLREMILQARREEEEEPQVPDEQLRANDQLQQDEILALEAIYGESIGIFDENGELRSFQINVHFEITDGISVSAELFQGVDGDTESQIHTFVIQHLPPISLTCVMPVSYPSHNHLYFTLSSHWLGRDKVSSLCHMLDSIWKQQPGQEVVYEWVQWLQSSALSHLGFDDGIVLRQDDSTMGAVDVRAVVEITSLESVVHWLISYNEKQCHESFRNGLHDCMICLSEYADAWRVTQECMYKEGTVQKLLCPHDKCGGVIPPDLLKRLLGDADFERWERLTLQKTLDSMDDVSYCPRCETVCLEDEDNNAQCSKCFFNFCTRCRVRRHIGDKCVILTPEEKLLSLLDRERVHATNKGNTAKRINLVNEMCSIKELLRDAVPCPHCRIAISRVAGCSHMYCRNCGNSFCYDCGMALDRNHTSEQCRLDQEQLSVRQHDIVKQVKRELVTARYRTHPCPRCRVRHPKIGYNNHIFCWACQVHYCALCLKVVQKSSEHYGPRRRCRQYSGW